MSEEALQYRETVKTMIDTLADPQFWYESSQNWPSEFLSIGDRSTLPPLAHVLGS